MRQGFVVLLVVLGVVGLSIAGAPKAKAPAKVPVIDKKSSDRDQATAIAWVKEHCIVDGWKAKRWEYRGQYKGTFSKGKTWNVYLMRFAPDLVLGDEALPSVQFYFDGAELKWPSPAHPVDTTVGVGTPGLLDFIKDGADRDLSGKRKKGK